MKQEIPWNRFTVEAIVIVGSILLAFSIDALWEERRDLQQEHAVLTNLESQFSVGLEALDNNARILGDREDYAIQLLEANGNKDVYPSDSVLTALSTIFLSKSTLNFPSGALDSYLASGNSDLIRNPELRNLLASWSSLIDDLVEEEIATAQLIETELRPFLMSRVPLGPVYSAHPADIFGDFPSKEMDTDSVDDVFADPLFSNFVTARLARVRIEQREIGALTTSASEILSLLRQEIN